MKIWERALEYNEIAHADLQTLTEDKCTGYLYPHVHTSHIIPFFRVWTCEECRREYRDREIMEISNDKGISSSCGDDEDDRSIFDIVANIKNLSSSIIGDDVPL